MNKKYTALAVAMLIGMSFTSSYAKPDASVYNQSGKKYTVIYFLYKIRRGSSVLHSQKTFTLKPGENKKGLPWEWGGRSRVVWGEVGSKKTYDTDERFRQLSVFYIKPDGGWAAKQLVPKIWSPKRTISTSGTATAL